MASSRAALWAAAVDGGFSKGAAFVYQMPGGENLENPGFSPTLTKRRIIVQARTSSSSTWWAFAPFQNDNARCGSKRKQKPARRQEKLFFNKERKNHRSPEEPRRGRTHECPPIGRFFIGS